MSVKRILTALRLDKIAAVDRPCQAPALAALIKRQDNFATILKAKYTDDQRKEMAGKEAMEDGSYPIKDAEDLAHAIHAVGRGRNNSHTAIRAHIVARAKALGLEDKIPDTWSDGGKLAKSLCDALRKGGLYVGPDDETNTAENFNEVLQEQELTGDFWDAYYNATSALQEALMSAIKDDTVTDKQAAFEESIKQFADHMGQILPGDIGKSLAAGIAASVGQPGTTTGEVMTPELKKALGLPETATDADVMKAVGDNAAALTKANEDLEKAKKVPAGQQADGGADDPDADDEMKKALASGNAFRTPEGAVITKKAVGDGIYAVLKSQNDQIAKQAADLAKARDAEEERTFAKKAEDLGLGGDFGPTMRKAYSGDAAAQAELEKKIDGLQRQVESGELFKNFGHNAPAADSATAEFVAKVEEIQKANPDLTYEQAYAKAYTTRANAPIVKRMKAETRQAAAN